VQVDDDRDHPAWVCAQASRPAIRAVLDGRASPRDVLRHSATGTVELVRVADGRAVPDRCLLCAEVDECLSSTGGRPAGSMGPEPGVVEPGPGTGDPGPPPPGGHAGCGMGPAGDAASMASAGPARAILAA
jgi:hypothetical protein